MLSAAMSAIAEAGLFVMATVRAPARPASASICSVSSVRPVVEIPIATVSSSWIAALVSPVCTSAQAYALMPMR
jgi:hypothetical protein